VKSRAPPTHSRALRRRRASTETGVAAQALISMTLELAALADGAEDATAACSIAAPEDAGAELVEGEEAGPAATAV
jgi:hypothetical protein